MCPRQTADLPQGDYSYFASQVESLFRSPVLVALDEYGIPLPLADKLARVLRGVSEIDDALAILKRLDASSLRLGPFETRMLEDAIKTL